MRELEQQDIDQDAMRFAGKVDAATSLAAEKAARQAAEAQHLQALQEAAAETRRDRKRLQQKMQELEDRDLSADANYSPCEASSTEHDVVQRVPRASSLGSRQVAEAQRLQDLQEAAVETRRERRRLQQSGQDHDQAHSPAQQASPDTQAEQPSVEGFVCTGEAELDRITREAEMDKTADRTMRRTLGQSSLRFLGDLVAGAKSGSRPATASATPEPTPRFGLDADGASICSPGVVDSRQVQAPHQEGDYLPVSASPPSRCVGLPFSASSRPPQPPSFAVSSQPFSVGVAVSVPATEATEIATLGSLSYTATATLSAMSSTQ